jgi:hypothetical protein
MWRPTSFDAMSDCAVVKFDPSQCAAQPAAAGVQDTCSFHSDFGILKSQDTRRRNSEIFQHRRHTHDPELCWYYMVVIPHLDATEADEVEVRVVGGQAIAQVRC